MSFKPKQEAKQSTYKADPTRKFPVPEAGNQPARISVIVDLGVQERPDFEDKNTGETKPQKPISQVAICVDLVDQDLDYGEIGVQPYRLLLNKSFKGEIEGVTFSAVPYRDGDGKLIETKKPWTFHPANLLTKLAKATGHSEIIDGSKKENMDISRLLGAPLFVEVEVKTTVSDKKDEQGNAIVYSNVNPKTYSSVPKIKGLEVAPLKNPAVIVTFDEAKAEDIKWIRRDILKKIKQATNYQGSAMQKAIEEFEAKSASETSDRVVTPAKKEKPVKAKAAPVADEGFDEPEFDSDVPF
jgi:hypothetical protein